MPRASKSSIIEVVYASGSASDQHWPLDTAHADRLIKELARALARMAARDDDAMENGV